MEVNPEPFQPTTSKEMRDIIHRIKRKKFLAMMTSQDVVALFF